MKEFKCGMKVSIDHPDGTQTGEIVAVYPEYVTLRFENGRKCDAKFNQIRPLKVITPESIGYDKFADLLAPPLYQHLYRQSWVSACDCGARKAKSPAHAHWCSAEEK